MTIIISLLLLASLLPHLTFTARVSVGIVNGREAKPHSRPYMVSVQAKEKHICGGFLISDILVMTAAHCRYILSPNLTVVLGAHDLQQKNLDRINVEFHHVHPDYIKGSFHDDILILRLEKHVELNNNIKKISIPTKEDDIKTDTVCSVAGWGSLVTNGKRSDRLMETNVTVMDNMKCESKWGKEFSASQMMCVHGKGGSCDGDSGGPLVCGDTAVGVTSFGDPDECNSLKLPEVYMKISAYLPWIKSIIGNIN